jgi:hypothetical protein
MQIGAGALGDLAGAGGDEGTEVMSENLALVHAQPLANRPRTYETDHYGSPKSGRWSGGAEQLGTGRRVSRRRSVFRRRGRVVFQQIADAGVGADRVA